MGQTCMRRFVCFVIILVTLSGVSQAHLRASDALAQTETPLLPVTVLLSEFPERDGIRGKDRSATGAELELCAVALVGPAQPRLARAVSCAFIDAIPTRAVADYAARAPPGFA